MNRQKTELAWPHFLRTLAIYLVLMLHCISAYVADGSIFGTKTWWGCNIISCFVRMGVPLFFMLSGYLLLSKPETLDIKAFYKKRFGRILLPFLVWNIFYFVLRNRGMDASAAVKLFFEELVLQGSKYHLWFIYSIAALYLLAPFIKRVLDALSKKGQLCFLLVILFPVTILRFVNVVFSVNIRPFGALVEGYAGFFIYGFILGSAQLSKKMWGLIYLLGIIGAFIGIFGNYAVSSPERMNLYFNEGYSLTHYLTAGAVFTLAKSCLKEKSAGRIVPALSKLSFGIYFSHVFFLEMAVKMLPELSPALMVPVSFVITAVAATAFSFIVSKIPVLRKIVM